MNRRVIAAAMMIASAIANSPIAASSPARVWNNDARKVYGLDSVTSMAYGTSSSASSWRTTSVIGSGFWPGPGCASCSARLLPRTSPAPGKNTR